MSHHRDAVEQILDAIALAGKSVALFLDNGRRKHHLFVVTICELGQLLGPAVRAPAGQSSSATYFFVCSLPKARNPIKMHAVPTQP